MTTPEERTIRIFIVGDHALVRAGLRLLVESREGLRVVAEAEAEDADVALDCARREQPDIILLDVETASLDGLELITGLRSAAAAARVLVVTRARDADAHARAMRLGAMGIVMKNQTADVFFKAVEKVHEGEVWFDRAVIGAVLFDMARRGDGKTWADGPVASLTVRELEIITMLCEGTKNREIARNLRIKESTVSHHLTSIFNKLKVSDRLELVMYAFRHRLASPPSLLESGGVPKRVVAAAPAGV